MRFVLAIALLLFAGCGHDSTRPSMSGSTNGSDTLMMSANSAWRVKGSIIDAETEEPLIGANVFLRYRDPVNDSLYDCGVATNANEKFTILVRSRPRPILVQLTASYPGNKRITVMLPQFSGSVTLEIGDLVLQREPVWYIEHRNGSRPMFDKTQTNARTVITEEEIQNLPIAK